MSDGSSAPYPTSIITCVTYTAQPSWNTPLPKIVPQHRRRAVVVDALQVMPGDRLVDGEQPEHPRVVLAQVRLLALLRPILGDRGDREEGLLVGFERPGGIEHRAAEGTHEGRRPADVERFVCQPDQVALAAERLDPLELLAAEVEQLLGRRVVGGDRVEDAAHQALLVGGRFGSSGNQVGHSSVAIRTISARTAS